MECRRVINQQKPSIVCIGTNLESQVALEGLLKNNARVEAVVTRPAGNDRGVCDYVDLHPLCDAYGVKTLDTVDINSTETVQLLRHIGADYFYTLGWSQLFSTEVLTAPKHYVVGSHPSTLPQGRGRAPVPWTLIEGQRESAISLFRMAVGADDGDLLRQDHFEIPERANASDLYQIVADQLRDAFVSLYNQHCESTPLTALPQDESLATHRAKRSPADGHLDFSEKAETLDRLVRAVAKPFPGAYTYYQGTKVTVWSADPRGTPAYSGRPGQILLLEKDRLLVQAADQPIWFSDLQIDQAPVSLQQFRIGSHFGYRVEDELHRLRNEVAELKRLLLGQVDLQKANREAA